MSSSTVCILMISLLIVVKGEDAHSGPIIEIRQGKLQGDILYLPGNIKPAYAFLNIPFAAPPVGDLRFEPPQPAESWSGVRDATKHGLPCVQNLKDFYEEDFPVMVPKECSEDCLQLNVYTPSVKGSNAVMFFIHGGGFSSGWADSYDSRAYPILEDVVVVVIQYRIGAFGFLTTTDDQVLANIGLRDQIAALRWVKENIADFGGNPDEVTIFGESAGSMSVSALLISPHGEGLFQRAIMQSGSITSPMTNVPRQVASQQTSKLADMLNCSSENPEEMVNCLRRQPADMLWAPLGATLELMFTTVVDGDFFPDTPQKLLTEGKFHTDVDVMMGVCQWEGYLFSGFFAPNFRDDNFNRDGFQEAEKLLMTKAHPGETELIEALTEAIVQEYEQGDTTLDVKKALTEFIGDYMIAIHAAIDALEINAKTNGNSFFYEMAIRPSTSTKPSWVTMDHGEDMYYTFGAPISGKAFNTECQFTETEYKFSQMLIKYWANFAKTGTPNGDGLPEWPSFKDDTSYIILKPEPEIAKNYKPGRIKFWSETLPEIVQKFSPHATEDAETEHTEL